MKQFKTIIIVAALLATACTKDIEYKGPDSERMLIVNCITGSGEIPVFKVCHSAFFLDSYYSGNAIKSGVNVSVDINGVARNAAYIDSLKGYTDGRAIQDGDIISVTASHSEYGTATASDTVPKAQDLKFSEYTKEFVQAHTMNEIFDEYAYDFNPDEVDSVLVAELEIVGNHDKSEFYMLTVEPSLTYIKYNEYEEMYDTIIKYLHYKIPAETKVLMGQTDATTAVLEDTEADSQYEFGKKSFIFDNLYIKDGNKLCFEILMEKPDTLEWIYLWNEVNSESEYNNHSIAHLISDDIVYTLDVKLYVLSNAYYYYHKSVTDYRNADDISFLSEPVTILHNVEGGAGILGTYTGKAFHSERTCKFK